MYSLSDRCEMLRDEAMNSGKYNDKYAIQRMIYFKLGMAKAERAELSYFEITAEGIANTLDKFMPVIIPGEIITGFNFAENEWGVN